jgi:hypothetical protein
VVFWRNKMKKILTLAVAIAAASSANAAWQTGTTSGIPGELILTVWNPVTETAFSQDLGILTQTAMRGLLADSVFNLSAAGLAHVGNTSDLRWSVTGLSSNPTVSPGVYDWHGFGYYLTSSTGGPTLSWNQAGIGNQYEAFANYNLKLGNASQLAATNPVVLTQGTTTYAGSGAVWGEKAFTLGDKYGIASTAEDDLESMVAYSIAMEIIPGVSSLPYLGISAGTWKLDAAGGTLTYSTVSEVPVPAAAWLFGSALLGLATVGRKRK